MSGTSTFTSLRKRLWRHSTRRGAFVFGFFT